jgi:hypothetical protein
MTTSTLAATGNGVLLLALWTAATLRRIPPRIRLTLALLSFASAWSLCYGAMRLGFPKWTVLPGTAALLISLVLLVVTAQLTFPHDNGSGGEDGGGGLDRPPPDYPLKGGGDPTEPEWWPEFEREFARFEAERVRAAPPVPAR